MEPNDLNEDGGWGQEPGWRRDQGTGRRLNEDKCGDN